MITRFHVQNYKALRDVTLDLTPIHVLIGPNDSGKTSILEALAALSRSTELDLEAAFQGPWSGFDLVWKHIEGLVIQLEATVEDPPDHLTYALGFRVVERNRRSMAIQTESLRGNSRTLDLLLGPGLATSRLTNLGQYPIKSEASQDLAVRVRNELRGIQIYRWNPRLLSLPTAPDSRRKFRMEESGFGLCTLLDEILSWDRARFGQLEQRFCEIFPQMKSIRLKQERAYRVRQSVPLMLDETDGKGIHFEFHDGTVVPAAQASDGLLLVLAYLAILHLPEPPRLLLVEEPENGIYPARIKEVLKILRDLITGQTHCQVVLTTHSPYVLDLFKPEEVTLCRRETDGSISVHPLSKSKAVREQIDIFSLGEIWSGQDEDTLAQGEAPSERAAS